MINIFPVKASGFLRESLPEEREPLIRSGILPVNDVFLPLFNEDFKIALLWGGRGGGKSEGAIDYLITDTLTQSYNKVYYGRKEFESLRKTSFPDIIKAIRKRGLEGQFRFSDAPNSSMVIQHKPTGNVMIPFGLDKYDKSKGFADPTHIWIDEADQIEFKAFSDVYPTLRTVRGKNQMLLTFNSYSVMPDHWIMRTFFPDLYEGDEVIDFDALHDIKVLKIFANYFDNYFIDREEYERQLRLAAAGNQHIYDGLANGHWGVPENNNPWLYAFDRERHVRKTLPFLPSFDVYLSFDFNNDPFACTAWQMSPQKGLNSSFLHCIKEFSGSLKIEEMCQRIKATFPNSILHITGDRSGQNEDVGRNRTLYDMIASYLGVSKKLMNLNTTNLEHADSRMLCNAMFANYPNMLLSEAGCPNLIRQCMNARVDPDSSKPSHLLKDRGLNKNDELDSMRYVLQSYFHQFVKMTYIRVLKK